MCIKVKNIATSEVVEIKNTGMTGDGQMYVLSKSLPVKWAQKNPAFILTGNVLAEGAYKKYELVASNTGEYEILPNDKTPRTRASKPQPQPATQPEPLPEPPAEVVVEEPTPEPSQAPQPAPAQVPGMAEMTNAFAALTPLFSGVQDNVMRAVMDKMQPIINDLQKAAATQARRIEVVSPQGVKEVNGITHEKFEQVCKLVQADIPVYLFGDAGTGKSDLAKQVAEALGLPFFQTSCVAEVYQLKGYGDANGNFVETAFYKAFTQGGVFLLDEIDASSPDALVAINNAISQREFDFPVAGNVHAHDNFRIIATGNTKGTGATEAYTGRQVQDGANLNRFFYVEIDYSRAIEDACTGNDEEIVNFIHDLRKAAKCAGITIILSYRQMKMMARLKDVLCDEEIIRGCVIKEKEVDEIAMLLAGIDNNNRWVKALKKSLKSA